MRRSATQDNSYDNYLETRTRHRRQLEEAAELSRDGQDGLVQLTSDEVTERMRREDERPEFSADFGTMRADTAPLHSVSHISHPQRVQHDREIRERISELRPGESWTTLANPTAGNFSMDTNEDSILSVNNSTQEVFRIDNDGKVSYLKDGELTPIDCDTDISLAFAMVIEELSGMTPRAVMQKVKEDAIAKRETRLKKLEDII